MNIIGQIIIIAMLVESLWETIKMTWQNGKISIDRIGALIIGIALSILCNLDIFILVGISINIPFIAAIFTGILLSRGANFIHDLFNKIASKNKITDIDEEKGGN